MSVSFVIDASIAASWFLPDEESERSSRLITALGDAPGLAPTLFWFETRNIFTMAERRGRIDPGMALTMALKLRELPILDGGAGSDPLIISLTLKHQLSAYDASYLALAIAEARPLATADRKLARAARDEGLTIMGPLDDAF